MQAQRSFADYVKQRFDNDFWAVAESYLESNIQTLDLEQRRIHRAGDYEITNVNVEYIWVEDKTETEIHFDVALSIWFDVHEGDYHYDDYDEHIVWIIAHCRGDLEKNLDDFEILNVSKYNGKSRPQNPMDDSLVPIIPYDNMDEVATAFLTEHYPAALSIPKKGQPPVWVDPTALAKNLGLSVQCQRIRKDASVFGQLYFDDTDTIIYDEVSCTDVMTHINGKTILVDPQMYYLTLGRFRNLLIKNNLQEKLFKQVVELLTERGLILKKGTIVDSTIISAPSSTKNADRQRDSEAHQVKKGNIWYFGYKAHAGVDESSGLVHTLKVTPANQHDVTMTAELMHGDEERLHGDSGYLGADKRENAILKNRSGKKIKYIINRRPSQSKELSARAKGQIKRREREKSSVRAKVEHVFAVVKKQLRYRKTRYRGLRKQTAKLNMMFALANLIMADRPCLVA